MAGGTTPRSSPAACSGLEKDKAFVKVDEEGTEAAAATAVVMGRGGSAPTPPANEFRADHPFLFLLRDTRSGAVLFIGRVVDPS